MSQAAVAAALTSYAGGASNVASVGVAYQGANCPGQSPPSLALAVTLWAPVAAGATPAAALLAAAQLPGSAGAAALALALNTELRGAGITSTLAAAFTFYPENMPSPPPPSPPPTPPGPPIPDGVNDLLWLALLALLAVPMCVVGVTQCGKCLARKSHERRAKAYAAMQKNLLGDTFHEKVTAQQLRAMQGTLRYDDPEGADYEAAAGGGPKYEKGWDLAQLALAELAARAAAEAEAREAARKAGKPEPRQKVAGWDGAPLAPRRERDPSEPRRKRSRRPRPRAEADSDYSEPQQVMRPQPLPPYAPPRPFEPPLEVSPFSLGWDQMPAALGREAAGMLRLFTGGADPEEQDPPPMQRRPRVRRAELRDGRV